MYFIWQEEYSVNVKEIDEQHKTFLGIMNKLYDFIVQKKSEDELIKIFNELADYADQHFKTEEKYFDEFNYEGSKEHKEEHEKLRNKIGELKLKIDKKEETVSFEFLDFLEDWLITHLSDMDKKYTKCFNDHGLY